MKTKILLVDDDDLVLDSLTEILADAGYEVLPATNAASALNHCKSGTEFAVLISDLTLTGSMDGPELARTVLDMDCARHVLFISGHPDAEVRISEDSPPCRVLAKPFSGQDLLNIVRGIARDTVGYEGSGHAP